MFITVNHSAFRVLQNLVEPSVDTARYSTRRTDVVTLFFIKKCNYSAL